MSYSFEEVIHQVQESTPLYSLKSQSPKFLVDAQLPKKLSDFLRREGFESIHTLELPDKNATADNFIKELSHRDGLILITKDDDFLRSFLIQKKPPKLILVKTGNIDNTTLMEIFEKGLTVITSLLDRHALIEITREEIVTYG